MKKLIIFLFLILTIQSYSQQWFQSYDLGRTPGVNFDYYVSTDTTDFSIHITTTRGKSASKTKLKGVVFSITNNTPIYPSDASNDWRAASNINGDGGFQVDVHGLIPNQLYYCRLFAINNVGITYDDPFTYATTGTVNYYQPTVQTASTATEIGSDYVYIGGSMSSNGGIDPTEWGVCWGTSSNPTISGDHQAAFSGDKTTWTAAAMALSPSTTYHFRSYSTNSVGTGYGSDQQFTTNAAGSTIPTVTILNIADIRTTSAMASSQLISNGGSTILSKGIVWATHTNPTLSDYSDNYSPSETYFNNYMNGLTSSTHYYVRAFATNSVGTAYSNQMEFTTISSDHCGLSWFILLTDINTECSAYTFSGSLTLAQQACSDWFNPTCCYYGGVCGLSGLTVKASSLAVGQQIYDAYTPPCNALTISGYYLWLGGPNGPAYIITVVNGIITANSQCYP